MVRVEAADNLQLLADGAVDNLEQLRKDMDNQVMMAIEEK